MDIGQVDRYVNEPASGGYEGRAFYHSEYDNRAIERLSPIIRHLAVGVTPMPMPPSSARSRLRDYRAKLQLCI